MNKDHPRTEREFGHQALRQAVRELNLDEPIYAHRVVGERIELRTRSQVYRWPPESTAGRYADWSRAELYQFAQGLQIPGRSRMSREELVAAIRSQISH